MLFSVHDVLTLLASDRAAAPKVLQQKLGFTDSTGSESLQLVLDALEKLGLVEKTQGRYRRLSVDDLVYGRLRCSSKGLCIVIPEDAAQEEVVVEGDLKNAWNGDRVFVRLLKRASRRRKPEGEILVVTERANPVLIGRVEVGQEGTIQVIPLDERLTGTLDLESTGEMPPLESDQIVRVTVERYPLGRRPARTRLVQILGRVNEPDIDIELVRSRYQIPAEWPDSVTLTPEAAAPALPREDLRELEVLGLSGQIAVSLIASATGGWQLGLHTGDLTPFVPIDSPVDREARARGCAAFLRDQPAPLWPTALIERCTLVAGEERLAWSLLVNLDADSLVRDFRFAPSLVRVTRQVEGELPAPFQRLAAALGTQYASIAAEPGSSLIFAELLELLLGQHLAHLHLGAPFLTQAAPEGGQLVDWLRLARARSLTVPEGEPPEPPTFELFRQWLHSEPVVGTPLLREMLIETLPTVSYAVAPGAYFGRNSLAAVAFDSPLERYADLLTQRILADIVVEGRDRKSPRSKVVVDLRASGCHGLIDWPVLKPKQQKFWEELLPAVLPRLQERTVQTRQAGRDLASFSRLSDLIDQTEPLMGMITGVQSYGFFVALDAPFVEGLVHVSGLKDDWYTYQAREPALVGRRNRKRYQIGDAVRVKIKSIDYYRQQVDLMILRNGSDPLPAEPGTDGAPLSEAEGMEEPVS